MDEDEMAHALWFELNKEPWKCEELLFNEFILINEDGEKFKITVEKEDT